MLHVEEENIALVDGQYRDVHDPEESLEEGLVHVPVVAVVDEAPVGVLDHHEPAEQTSKRGRTLHNIT